MLAPGHNKQDGIEESQITSEVFVKPFTATELQQAMASAQHSLQDLGFQLNARQDMQAQLKQVPSEKQVHDTEQSSAADSG